MKNTTALFMSLSVPSDGGAPEWIHVLPAGTFSGKDGRGPYRVADAQTLIANSLKSSDKLVVDENHSTDLAAPRGDAAPARGWIVELQARADGIWGRVEWTASGTALLADRAYKGISPVIRFGKSRVVEQILRASLVNDPNLTELKTLHASEKDTNMDLMSQIRATLALDNDADDTAVLAAITALAKGNTSLQSGSVPKELFAALGVKEKADDNALLAAIEALKAKAEASVDTSAFQQTITELQASVTTMQTEAKRKEAETVIDRAIADGKPIKPMRDRWIARHMVDAKGVGEDLKALPSIHEGGVALHTREKAEGIVGEDASPDQIIAAAKKFQAERKTLGETIAWHQAVSHVTGMIAL